MIFSKGQPIKTVPNISNLEGLGRIFKAEFVPLPFLKERTTGAFLSRFFFEFSKFENFGISGTVP